MSSEIDKIIYEFVDPLDPQKNLITITANECVQDKEYIYIKTEFSNCILTLRKNESNQLIDLSTGEVAGRLVSDTSR